MGHIKRFKEILNEEHSDDMKNGKKSYLIDQTLSKEEYRKQLTNKINN